MNHLVIFLEEPSAREMLKGLLPRILPPSIAITYIVFQGKQDLEKRLPMRLRAWKAPDSGFIVLRDKDLGNCISIKNHLKSICLRGHKPDALIRIACHELESWYLGDLQAVELGLSLRGLVRQQQKRKFRLPDLLANPAQELKRLTVNVYTKVGGSRLIGPHLSLTENTSHSYGVFIEGIKRLASIKYIH